MTIEDLAEMVKRGFDNTATKEDIRSIREDMKLLATKQELNDGLKGLEQAIDERFDHVDARLDTIEHDISDLPEIRQDRIDIDERLTKVDLMVAHA